MLTSKVKYFLYFIISIFLLGCNQSNNSEPNNISSSNSAKPSNLDFEPVHTSDEGINFYRAKGSICNKVTDITSNFAEEIAIRESYPISSVHFIRIIIHKDNSCSVLVDTPKGPKDCLIGSIAFNKDEKYVVTAYHKLDDGRGLNVGGSCIEPWNF